MSECLSATKWLFRKVGAEYLDMLECLEFKTCRNARKQKGDTLGKAGADCQECQ